MDNNIEKELTDWLYSLGENMYLAVNMDDEELDTLVAEDLGVDIEEIDPTDVIKYMVLHVTLVCESLTDGMERKRIKVKK